MSVSEAFAINIDQIRANARQQVLDGAKTFTYQGDVEEVIRQLNSALATELVCVLRYKLHHFSAKGIHSESIAEEFAVHAAEELSHADQLAERIVQLGGTPNFSPEGLLQRSHADYVAVSQLSEMIRENLVAERIAIDTYRELIRFIGDKDPTTRRLLEDILAVEEKHADELADWLTRAH
ncbi:Bacterioferritin [Andreprevotia sp. IGB-42]|uniref:ferritin-like domain-containing protein n=1 Tax=Andreprevotia sp. IGB-42 TaxID=2497473 RepID=UPI00135A6C1D|nr:ferritin-like domain-containing protein [Andreprevotia sp. IGB-42]KAF0813333.1 Bacterioferritin [Andreprevotia sp. IGB-42]